MSYFESINARRMKMQRRRMRRMKMIERKLMSHYCLMNSSERESVRVWVAFGTDFLRLSKHDVPRPGL
jgi:hypothetical protein